MYQSTTAMRSSKLILDIDHVFIGPRDTPVLSSDWLPLGRPASRAAHVTINYVCHFVGGGIVPESGDVQLSILDLSVEDFLAKLPLDLRRVAALLMRENKHKSDMSFYSPSCGVEALRLEYFLAPKPMNHTLIFRLEMFSFEGKQGLLQWRQPV